MSKIQDSFVAQKKALGTKSSTHSHMSEKETHSQYLCARLGNTHDLNLYFCKWFFVQKNKTHFCDAFYQFFLIPKNI